MERHSKISTITLWILSLLITVASAYYQKTTGPTYPVSGETEFGGMVKYELIRSNNTGENAEIRIFTANDNIEGYMEYKRLNSNDEWMTMQMFREGKELVGAIPEQPASGKVEYRILLLDGQKEKYITEHPVVIRFKGPVPAYVLIPHILFMFFGMMLSTRVGLEAIFNRKNIKPQVWVTFIFILLGGMILGPVVQKFAFDAYWTGFPFGTDLTDNKTLIAMLFWFAALVKNIGKQKSRSLIILAAIVTLVIFLIPHSMFGSELDYTTGTNKVYQ